MEAKYTFSLTWCERHKNWWVTNCPDCMVDSNEESIKREGRREVVECMRTHPSELEEKDVVCRWFPRAKLKEWGL